MAPKLEPYRILVAREAIDAKSRNSIAWGESFHALFTFRPVDRGAGDFVTDQAKPRWLDGDVIAAATTGTALVQTIAEIHCSILHQNMHHEI